MAAQARDMYGHVPPGSFTQRLSSTTALVPRFGLDRPIIRSTGPGRTVLEIFAIRTYLQSRTRADNAKKHFILFSEKSSSVNGTNPLTLEEKKISHQCPWFLQMDPDQNSSTRASRFSNFPVTTSQRTGNETIKMRAIETPPEIWCR